MHVAYIGMGANLPSKVGPPEKTMAAAADRMQSLGRIASRSSLYSTEPVGFADQPRYLNAVVALETELKPRDLLNALMSIERGILVNTSLPLTGISCPRFEGTVAEASSSFKRSPVLAPISKPR